MAVIWAVSAVGKEGAVGWEGQDGSGEERHRPELPSPRGCCGDVPLRPVLPWGCTALLLCWELPWGRAHRAVKLPKEKTAEPRGLESVLSARVCLCPPATATLQPLWPAGIGKGVIYSLTAEQGFFCLPVFSFVWR